MVMLYNCKMLTCMYTHVCVCVCVLCDQYLSPAA